MELKELEVLISKQDTDKESSTSNQDVSNSPKINQNILNQEEIKNDEFLGLVSRLKI